MSNSKIAIPTDINDKRARITKSADNINIKKAMMAESTIVVACSTNPLLGDKIAKEIGCEMVEIQRVTFPNTELSVHFPDGVDPITVVRDKHIIIVHTGIGNARSSINDNNKEFEMTIQLCKLQGARKVTTIIPCCPYARSDKKVNGKTIGPIGAKLFLQNVENTGADQIVVLDLHSGQIQGFTKRISVDNMFAIKPFVTYLKGNVFGDGKKFVLVSPDVGGSARIKDYSNKLSLNHVILVKERDYEHPGIVSSTLTGNQNNQGKYGIIIDDMIDTMGTMIEAIKELKKFGFVGFYIIASHGILSGPALKRIHECDDILKVIVTNSIDQTSNMAQHENNKIEVVDVTCELIKNLFI